MDCTVRFLLTNNCTAHCAYCHNEGQAKGKNFLPFDSIEAFLENLASEQQRPTEIILSGGEPTLHPHLERITALCKKHCGIISMDTHGGHPKRLSRALPYLTELKMHIDSFDYDEQMQSMGIDLDRVLESIELARRYSVILRVNHPLRNLDIATRFVRKAREIGIDCKLIELFGDDEQMIPLASLDWTGMGYSPLFEGHWMHANGQHSIFTKRCGQKHNTDEHYFVDVTGVRRYLDGNQISTIQPISLTDRNFNRMTPSVHP